jgi:hypothetical protein
VASNFHSEGCSMIKSINGWVEGPLEAL